MNVSKHVVITPVSTELNGTVISHNPINELYREFVGDYPKFFKMDNLCKLGFLAAEFLLKELSEKDRENVAICIFNRNGSLITDRNYQDTISAYSYFPSPALFVYTLANIVTGEIAIRHKIYGETSFYILPDKDDRLMEEIAMSSLQTSSPSFILYGWVDYENKDDYLADLKLIAIGCADLAS